MSDGADRAGSIQAEPGVMWMERVVGTRTIHPVVPSRVPRRVCAMFNRGLWQRGSQALMVLIVLQGVVTGALRRGDVRRHLRWVVVATPTLWGRTLVLQVQPVSFVQQGSGPA